MSTTSQHLGLTVPDPSDPFQRTDFVNNYNKIDSYPGVFICTSTTHPVWGVNQAGMTIFETDTRRILNWDGSAWHEVQTTPSIWSANLLPAVTLTPGQTVTYTLATINARRPATVVVLIYVDGRSNRYPNSNSPFGMFLSPQVDNVTCGIYGTGNTFHSQWTEFPSNGTYNDYRTVSCAGMQQINAGSHSIGIQIGADTIGSNGGAVQRIGMLAFLANSTDI